LATGLPVLRETYGCGTGDGQPRNFGAAFAAAFLVRGSKNSALLEMEDGEQVVASRYAIRPVKNSPQTRFDFS
jgi:hypothetical protein